MRKNILRVLMVTALLPVGICGCRKAPEGSDDGGVFHAKDSVDHEVARIVEGTGAETGTAAQDIDCVIGTGENSLRIQAQMPDIPESVSHIVLGKNDALTKESLAAFLESDAGKLTDLSEQAKREAEELQRENEQSEEQVFYSVFGDDSVCRLTDGEKTAGFSHGTSAYYRDEALYEACMSVYKSADETALKKTEHAERYEEIEELLLERLSSVGVTELYIYEVVRYQSESVTCEEVKFTPAYEGMGLVHEFGSVSYGEVHPAGRAWICADRLAGLDMESCLGKVEQKEVCDSLLSWEQVEEILKVNLDKGRIRGSAEAVLTEAEFLYAPVFREDENKLELVPVWHLYTPMSAWIEDEALSGEFADKGAAWSICLHAVSGEIVRSE